MAIQWQWLYNDNFQQSCCSLGGAVMLSCVEEMCLHLFIFLPLGWVVYWIFPGYSPKACDTRLSVGVNEHTIQHHCTPTHRFARFLNNIRL